MDKYLNLLIKLEVIMVAWLSKIGKAVSPYAKEILKAIFAAAATAGAKELSKIFKKWLDSKNNPDSAEAPAK